MSPAAFEAPTRILRGRGSIAAAGPALRDAGAGRVLVVTDPGVRDAGLLDGLLASLDAAALAAAVYAGVSPNPPWEAIAAGIEAFHASDADALFGIGGGSSMDAAKVIGALARVEGDWRAYTGPDRLPIPSPVPPCACAPTTTGTGSEVTFNALVTDRDAGRKRAFIDRALAPFVAVLDPDLVDGCPAPVVAATGVDAMVHGIESFLNVQSNPITEALVLGGLRLLGPSLRPAVLSRLDGDARGRLLDGCALTALAMNVTGVGLVHAMSDPLTVHVHAPHGVANSALLPYVMAYNAPAAADRLAVLAAAVGVRDLPSGLTRLVADLGLPRTLAELGVTHDLIPRLAEDAMLSRNVALTCRPAAVGVVEAIYRRALDGPPPTEGETLP